MLRDAFGFCWMALLGTRDRYLEVWDDYTIHVL